MTRQHIVAAIAALAAVPAGIALLAQDDGDSAAPQVGTPVERTYRLDTDHPTYATATALKDDAEAIIRGTINDVTVVPGPATGVDAAGDPLPAPPSSHYSVRVVSSLKGSLVAGDDVTVVLTGGTTDDGTFVLDGGPVLKPGDEALFYLVGSTSANRASRAASLWYPLAGGAAVAVKDATGKYVLPQDVNGATVQKLDASGAPSGTPSGGGGGGGGGAPSIPVIDPVPPQTTTSPAVTTPAPPQTTTTTSASSPTTPAAVTTPAATVEQPSGTPGTVPGPVTGTGAPVDRTPPRLLAVRLGAKQKLGSVFRDGLVLRGQCSERCDLDGQIRAVAARGSRAALPRTLVIGSGRAAAGRPLVLRLTKSGRARLRGRSRVAVVVVVRAVDAAGNATVVRRTVTLTRKAAGIRG